MPSNLFHNPTTNRAAAAPGPTNGNRSLTTLFCFLLSVFCFLSSALPAYANCSNPYGEESDLLFNAEYRLLTFCDGYKWRSVWNTHGIPTAGLVAHWTLGDGEGTTARDSSGNGHHGTLVNDPEWKSGRLGAALEFDGGDSRVAVPYDPSLEITDVITLSVWIYPTANGQSKGSRIVRRPRTSNSEYYGLVQRPDNEARFIIRSGGIDHNLDSALTLPLNQWTHLSGTFDGSDMRLFINGVEDANSPLSLSGEIGSNSSAGLLFGYSADNNSSFQGMIDDVRIYNRALSEADIQALYDLGTSGDAPVWHQADQKIKAVGGTSGVLDIDRPDNVSEGDLLVLIWSTRNQNETPEMEPEDFTLFATAGDASASENPWIRAYYKIAGDNEPASYTFISEDKGNRRGIALLGRVTGFNPENPVAGTPGQDSSGNSSVMSITVPGITPGSQPTLRISSGVLYDQNIESQILDITTPGIATIATRGLGNNGNLTVGMDLLQTSAEAGTVTFEVEHTARRLAALSFAIAPAGACTNPDGGEGDLLYNADANVLQWCGAGKWHAAGPVPGAGGAGCSNPAGGRGDVRYFADYMVPVYCDGSLWQAMGPVLPAFATVWKTDHPGVSASDQITLPLTSNGTYDFRVSWGDGTYDHITQWDQAEVTHTYPAPGTYTVRITGTIEGWRFNNGGDKDKILDVAEWGPLRLGNGNGYFRGASNLNISASDVPNLNGTTTLRRFFSNADLSTVHPVINNWDMSNVLDISEMFWGTNFNQAIAQWDVSNVTSFSGMFHSADSFNQDIGSWDVSSAETMNSMLRTNSFNQDISSWNVSNVQSMNNMFLGASQFNQDLSGWNLSNVASMRRMFQQSGFDYDIGSWDVSNVTDMEHMFIGGSLSTENYDALLEGWAARPTLQNGVLFSAGNTQYCTAGAARQSIIDTYGWTIADGGLAGGC